MSNIIISLVIAVMSLHLFTVTYRLNGINRSLYNIPISIFESSIPLLDYNEEIGLYYNKETLKQKLTYYFNISISGLCHSYEMDLYFYNQGDDSVCLSKYCNAVEITINAKVIFFTEYHRTARFYISHN